MENSEYISTYEESSKIEMERDSNVYSNRITRNTLQQNLISKNKLKESLNSDNESSKNNQNETLPIKNYISNFKFKIVLLGNISVGKSSIIKRYIKNEFSNQYTCTVGTELSKKSLLMNGNKKIDFLIWDTCGQEKFRSVTRQSYRDTHAILLVFDLTNEKSLYDLQSWYEDAMDYINEIKCNFFLLGNKCDEKKNIKIYENDIKDFMKRNPKIKRYFEVSALNGNNIDLTFDKIGQHLILTFGIEEINKNIKEYKKNLLMEKRKKEHNANKVKCC